MHENSISFLEILNRLCDQNQPFPAKLLKYFSDLSSEQESMLAERWPQLENSRKISLLEDLEDRSERDTLVDFTCTGKVALKDEDEAVREAALRLLWDCEDKGFIHTFVNILRTDASHRVRSVAASLLGRFVLLGETDELGIEDKTRVEEALIESHQVDNDKLVKRRALESLGYSGREEISQLIHDAMSTKDTDWIASGLYAMGRSADTKWADVILQYLQNPAPAIREEAVRAAGELQLNSTSEILLDMLEQEEDDDVKFAIIWALSQIGGEGVREALVKQAEMIDDEEYLDFIEKALDNLDFNEELSHFDLIDIDSLDDTE